MERALKYLAKTDERYGQLEAHAARTEFLAKMVESRLFLTSDGKNVKERECAAKIANEVGDAWEVHFKAIAAQKAMRARRERAVITIDLWRSLFSARKQGLMM